MTALQNKIDFAALISVSMANPNGDPLNGNRPRTDYNGYGEISDVCIKRKIRNRMQDLGYDIFVQSSDRADDGFDSLSARAAGLSRNSKDFTSDACAKWMDVRSFGQVFAFKASKEGEDGVSVGVRGPVTIHQAVSISPVDVISMQITKSVNGESGAKKSSDTMGMKHFIKYGLYLMKGSINVQLAEKTGFSDNDAEVIKECIRTMFENDASSARPEGSIEVVRLYWWKHNCKDGQFSSARVHRSLHVELKPDITVPVGFDDYTVTLDPLDGLTPEIIEGV